MSRCGYSEDLDEWALIRWRGAVTSAIRGKRGQAFLKEMLVALDTLPEKKLISGELVTEQGEVCAIGSVIKQRGIDVSEVDVYDSEAVSGITGISEAMVKEIEYTNDEAYSWPEPMNDERRFTFVRNWVIKHIKDPIFGV